MRDLLKQYDGKTITLVGKFEKYGRKDEGADKSDWNTVLLTNLKFTDGTDACDHLWFIAQKCFLRTLLKKGAILTVTGKVGDYSRSNGSVDYGMKNYYNAEVIRQGKDIIPCKVWKNKYWRYFKFISDEGPRWYREVKENIERVKFEFKEGAFVESIVGWDDGDKEFLEVIRKF